jgi:hypothetical protein
LSVRATPMAKTTVKLDPADGLIVGEEDHRHGLGAGESRPPPMSPCRPTYLLNIRRPNDTAMR